ALSNGDKYQKNIIRQLKIRTIKDYHNVDETRITTIDNSTGSSTDIINHQEIIRPFKAIIEIT
ncbi:23527_t:CDS:1, partial [Gigaspora rosea]